MEGEWPNEDIKRDYQHLKKVTVDSKRDKENEDPNVPNSWRLMSVQRESGKYDKLHSLGNDSVEYQDDCFDSVKANKSTELENGKYKSSCNGLVDKWDKSNIGRSPTSSLSASEAFPVDESEAVEIPFTGSDSEEDDEDDEITMGLVGKLDKINLDAVVDQMEQELQSNLNMTPSGAEHESVTSPYSPYNAVNAQFTMNHNGTTSPYLDQSAFMAHSHHVHS